MLLWGVLHVLGVVMCTALWLAMMITTLGVAVPLEIVAFPFVASTLLCGSLLTARRTCLSCFSASFLFISSLIVLCGLCLRKC